jgi:AAA+ superfamily predicted ATPase
MTPDPIERPGENRRLADLPDWYPAWARELAESYFSGTTCVFILHGNVHDLIRRPDGTKDDYCNLSEFLATQVFGSWDVVLQHDLARGLRPLPGSDGKRLQSMVTYLSSRLGEPGTWPREAEKTLDLLDRFVERSLLDDSPQGRKSIGVVFEYAQYLVPAGDLAASARGDAARLVRLLNWAQNPYIKRVNMAFCLIADRLTEVHDRLVQSPHVVTLEIPMPDAAERERFANWAAGGKDFAQLADFTPQELAAASNGLTLVGIQVLLSQAQRSAKRVDAAQFKRTKKTMIERQCQGLLEFVEPKHTLDLVVGHESAKQRLRDDALYLTRGQLDAAPMGYLICGPVGTGKTFLAECYAGSVGIPCVKLRNFRSKYVGETEGNLEQVLGVLRSLGPVVVVIDEADAALGSRQSDGDSGTSSRVFSMIASQMGDTRYRGKILWMLLTCRPDLLPIDLKRQGRAEVHIPLFYPHDESEMQAMLQAMARKNKVELPAGELPTVPQFGQFSGADLESLILSAKRQAMAAGKKTLSREDLQSAIAEFIPSAQGLEKELQDVAAVLECTQLSFLTPAWREKLSTPNGRIQLQERFAILRQSLEQN